MKLGLRIFGCYLLVFLACFYWPLNWVVDTLRIRFYESVEEPLVDQANILAAMAGLAMERGELDPIGLGEGYQRAYDRPLNAKIYELEKTDVDIRVYMTDAAGKITFDSMDKARIGDDYSQWRDVRLTLEGKYGARTTKADSENPKSSVFYVAAPIIADGRTAGVLTVAKPTTNIQNLIDRVRPQIYRKGLVAAALAALLCFVVSVWLTRPIKRLTRYADHVRDGKRTELPKLDRTEIGDMGQAFEKMREALEGKKYVEQYIQTLTHEIKSPLSAIRGAAELLKEDVPPDRQAVFLANISSESGRIQKIVDRMLELSSLESRSILHKREAVDFRAMVNTVVESKQVDIGRKNLDLRNRVAAGITVKGDPFLLHQAVANLIQNAIDFCRPGGRIDLTTRLDDRALEFIVEDNGAAIPAFAQGRVFDKFFSLERPDSKKKSTGLGLNLVREVALLHQGDVELKNRPQGGVRAVLRLPAKEK